MTSQTNTQTGEDEDPVHLSERGMARARRWAWMIALGGFLFGYDTGVVSGALLFVRREFDLNSFEQGSVVSILLLGAMVGALGAGRVADRLGRRRTLALEGVVFALGTVIVVTATGYPVLLAGRIVLGLAIGGASATVPLYLSEVSPPQIRGRNLTLNQLMITTGILVSYLVDLSLASSGEWRWMFGAGLVPALALVLCCTRLPESASWLIARGREDEARRAMRQVTEDEAGAAALVERFRRRDEREARAAESAHVHGKGWRVLLAAPFRPALVVGLTVAAVQQLGGINTIIYYAPTIIENTGLTASNSIFYSVFIGLINLAMTLVAVRFVDRKGRRPLMLFSLTGMLLTLILMGLAFVADFSSVIALVFMVLYIASFAAGLGPVFWVLVGEVFPPSVRAVGSSAATSVNWLANFTVGLVFLPLADAIGQGETFWIFAGVCAFGLWFVARYVPETRGASAEEIQEGLAKRFHRGGGTSAGRGA
ncbi:bicyclomycin resistance protein TcaB [Streptomyces albus]|uniref:Bicyclomycin resistance protein TcaB n=2 Tax=Streptomyces albus subsp. albus TaxID=67257 RepID=H6D563_STRA4|nr:putative glucose-6-phosphate 1-dehydrogenase [Streptomyces albus]AJE80662.1 bicyclomycin resistance protein TcaB [Streptomyces albus]AOU74973.1 bicyclomycin resistance protein TcaB [Streptomyces albus]AYN30782.1 sugar porter family MFS transporter [Streptomyces albus]CCD31884.1 putative resistance protein [Streptomyces albus subsp. albus]